MNDQKKKEPLSSSEDEVSSEEEGEDLILEGVLVRNNEVSSSDESEDEEEVQPKKKKAKVEKVSDKPKKKQKEREPEIIPVEFTFNDANEKYFHGIKNYLLSHHVYAPHSSSIFYNSLQERFLWGPFYVLSIFQISPIFLKVI